MKKSTVFFLSLILLLACAGCGGKGMQAEVWLDYFQTDDMPWGGSETLTPPEFPGVTFTWTSGAVTADDGNEVTTLFTGMPIWNVYLCDLTGDGKPEFCATTSWGSGIVDDRVTVYDYVSGTSYVLVDRGFYDYSLIAEGASVRVVKAQYPGVLWSEYQEAEWGTLALAPDGEGNLQLVMEN